MRARLIAGISATLLALAPCFAAVQDDARQSGKEGETAAVQEARRQGVAANSKTDKSPEQSMRQAIAFERYKELSAEREARKEGRSKVTNNTADRSRDEKTKK